MAVTLLCRILEWQSVHLTAQAHKKIAYPQGTHVLDEAVSAQMRECLESVVAEGGDNKAYIEGYRIGGKTATSEKLPRGTGKYISSFVGFAPADDPEILGMCVIYDPQGIYYGGTIAAPVIGNISKIYCLILALKNNWKCSILGKVRD